MTNIDPARLVSILRSLSVKELAAKSNSSDNDSKVGAPVPSLIINDGKQRDKSQLRQSLRKRLKRLKTQEPDFEKKAPGVVIKEILLWEFGENIISHPEFNHIANNIISQIQLAKSLSDYLGVLVTELEAEDDKS